MFYLSYSKKVVGVFFALFYFIKIIIFVKSLTVMEKRTQHVFIYLFIYFFSLFFFSTYNLGKVCWYCVTDQVTSLFVEFRWVIFAMNIPFLALHLVANQVTVSQNVPCSVRAMFVFLVAVEARMVWQIQDTKPEVW